MSSQPTGSSRIRETGFVSGSAGVPEVSQYISRGKYHVGDARYEVLQELMISAVVYCKIKHK